MTGDNRELHSNDVVDDALKNKSDTQGHGAISSNEFARGGTRPWDCTTPSQQQQLSIGHPLDHQARSPSLHMLMMSKSSTSAPADASTLTTTADAHPQQQNNSSHHRRQQRLTSQSDDHSESLSRDGGISSTVATRRSWWRHEGGGGSQEDGRSTTTTTSNADAYSHANFNDRQHQRLLPWLAALTACAGGGVGGVDCKTTSNMPDSPGGAMPEETKAPSFNSRNNNDSPDRGIIVTENKHVHNRNQPDSIDVSAQAITPYNHQLRQPTSTVKRKMSNDSTVSSPSSKMCCCLSTKTGILLFFGIIVIGGGIVGGVIGRRKRSATTSASTVDNTGVPAASPPTDEFATTPPTTIMWRDPTVTDDDEVVDPAEMLGSDCGDAVGPLVVDQPPIWGIIPVSAMIHTTASCTGADILLSGRGVWFNITGGDEVLRASTCVPGSSSAMPSYDTDTRISVYTGLSCDDLDCVAFNDDFCGKQSSVSWFARKGEAYFILVHTDDRQAASQQQVNDERFVLTVGYEKNGQCNSHFLLSVSSSNESADVVVGSTKAANRSLDVPMCDGDLVQGGVDDGAVWYSVVGTGAWMQARTCHDGITDFDARINVLLDDCQGCQVVHDSSCGSMGAIVSWETQEDVEYRLLVFKGDRRAGSVFGISVNEFIPDSNCTTAPFLSLGTPVNGSTLGEPINNDLLDDCLGGFIKHPGVWYRLRGNGQRLLASTCSSITDYESRIAIFVGNDSFPRCGEHSCVASLSEQFCRGKGSVFWDSVDGLIYLIFVHGDGSQGGKEVGSFELLVDNFQVAVNDDCENAASISVEGSDSGNNALKGSTSSATFEVVASCDAGRSQAPGVWYSITTPSRAANLRASTCDPRTTFDAQMTIYEGQSCSQLSCVTTEDSSCGNQSSVVWQATPESVYYIFVHGRSVFSTGDFSLTVEEYRPLVVNDFCEDAILHSLSGSLTQSSTESATFDNAQECNGVPNTAPGVWYRVEGTGKNIEASLCHPETNFNAAITVFYGDCANLQCIVARNRTSGCGTGGAAVSWISSPGVTYHVLVHGFASLSGEFGLTVNGIESTVENDFCVTAQEQTPSNSAIVGTTIGATFDDALPCATVVASGPGVWYTVMGTGRRLLASTCDSPGDLNTRISVYSGSCGDLSCVFADDNGCIIKSRVVFETNRGETYYVLVHNADPESKGGEFELVVDEFVPAQGNDYCSSATQVPVDGSLFVGSTMGTSFDDTGACGTAVTGLGVWFLVLGTGERLRADTCNVQTTYDTKISIFTGSCDNLQCIDGNDDACGLRSSVSWDTKAGSFYWYVRQLPDIILLWMLFFFK